jgi:YVTN family beta-propeller protein
VRTGAEPEGVVVSADGATAYVASEAADLIHVIDLSASRVRANVVAGTRPRRLALTPDGKELWVSNELSGDVTVIDTSTLQAIKTIPLLPPRFRKEDVTPVGVSVSRDGRTVAVALGRANHVALVDASSKQVRSYVLAGRRPWAAEFSRDDKTIFVTNGLSDDITIIDRASAKALRSVPVGRTPHTVRIDD